MTNPYNEGINRHVGFTEIFYEEDLSMNKTELVAAIAEKTELSKKDSEKALKAFIDVVSEELQKGEKIQLVDDLRHGDGVDLVHLKLLKELQEKAGIH